MDTSPAPKLRKLMSARELSDFLGVHQNYVYDQAVNGDLPSYKIGGVRRFRWKDVEAWLEKHRHAAGQVALILFIVGVFAWLAANALASQERVRAKQPRDTIQIVQTDTQA